MVKFSSGQHSGCEKILQEEQKMKDHPEEVGKPMESIVWKAEMEKSFKQRSGEITTRTYPLDLIFWNSGVSSLIIYMQKIYKKELLKLVESEYKWNKTSKHM